MYGKFSRFNVFPSTWELVKVKKLESSFQPLETYTQGCGTCRVLISWWPEGRVNLWNRRYFCQQNRTSNVWLPHLCMCFFIGRFHSHGNRATPGLNDAPGRECHYHFHYLFNLWLSNFITTLAYDVQRIWCTMHLYYLFLLYKMISFHARSMLTSSLTN